MKDSTMNDADRIELESLKRRHQLLTEELAQFARRLEVMDQRLQGASARPAVVDAPAPLALRDLHQAPAPLHIPQQPDPVRLHAQPLEIPPMIIPLAAPVPAVPQVAPAPAPLNIQKGACQKCGGHLEYPAQSIEQEIRCPHCQEMTVLGDAPALDQVEPAQETVAAESIPLPPRLDQDVSTQPPLSFSSLPLPEAPAERGSFELRFGTFWAVRIGIVMVLTALGFAGYYAYRHYVPHLGAWGKIALLYLGSGGLLGVGAWFQRQQVREGLRNYGQVVMAGGLAAVYFTTYVAHYIPGLRVIESALVDGFLLLGWAGFMVWLADRRRSEVMALFAVGLAWYTSLVTKVGVFTLYSNLLLTVAAVVFLVRNRWATLSFASLIGTYGAYGYWRFYQNGVWLLDLGASPESLWHGITMLGGYWLAFTTAVFLSRDDRLQGGRRLSFLTLNNGAFFGLTVATMYSTTSSKFWLFSLVFGGVLLGLGVLARAQLAHDPPARGGYVTQGLLLVTIGLIAKFTGLQLGLMLAAESTTLLALGYARQSQLLRFGSHVVAALAVAWGIDGTQRFDHSGLIMGAAIAAFMLINAVWAARKEDPAEQAPLRLSPGFFATAGLVMLFIVTWANVSSLNLPPVLAVEALVLALSVHVLGVRELTLLGQINLVIAQGWWLIQAAPTSGAAPVQPWWNPALILAISVGLGHWWQKQRAIVVDQEFVRAAQLLYGLATVGVLQFWLEPHFHGERWLAGSAVLAVAVTVYGLATRAWILALCGQFFVGLSVWHFVTQLSDGDPGWGFALVPMVVLFSLPALALSVLQRQAAEEAWLTPLRQLGIVYRASAVLMALVWVHHYIPEVHRFWVLALAGAVAFAINGWRRNLEGLLLAAVLTVAGLYHFAILDYAGHPFHVPSLLAILLILGQQRAIRRFPSHFAIPAYWNEVIIVVGSLALGLFATRWVQAAYHLQQLPLAWTLLGVAYVGLGAWWRERAYAVMNLVALCAALGLFGMLALEPDQNGWSRAVFIGNLAPMLALIAEQIIARRLQPRLVLPEPLHQGVIVAAAVGLWIYVTRAIQVQSGGFYLTVGWTMLGFALIVLGFARRERMHRWSGLGLLALALGRVAVFDFWKLGTVHQILSALALGIAFTVLGFIYNRAQETIRKWL